MDGFFSSFKPLLVHVPFKKYRVEFVLIGVALCIAVVSFILYLQEQHTEPSQAPPSTLLKTMKTTSGEKNIVVDISGSVKNPGVYVLPASARIDELLKRAGGMADDADVAFASRNVNRARILTDQEKIYIPSLNDTAQGIVSEYKRVIDYTQPVTHLLTESSQSTSPSGSALVNINTAAIEELDQLPGVGAAIGQSIISKRPYLSIDELVQRSVVKQTVFDKIKNSITVQE